jgi:hypothetical protein
LSVETVNPADEELFDQLQCVAFGYFLHAGNPANGLVANTSREKSPASIAVVGFAPSSYLAAVEHAFAVAIK